MSQSMFSSDIELGKFLGSIDLIPYAFRAISETSSIYQLHTSPSGIQVLAFNCSPDYTNRFLNGEFGLVSSQIHQVNDFISTMVNPNVSINKAAIELFDQYLSDKLLEIENQLVNGPLVVTGRGLGGYLAILFTLRKQHSIDVEESNASKCKRPICITFGSPLVGDEAFQRAILERPQWTSSFLNVVAKKDHAASFFSSSNRYKPIGTFLFCTESGGHTAFEDQEAILAVLDAMASSNVGIQETYDYGNILSSMRKKVLYRGVSELGNFNLNPLRAGITLQFQEVGVLDDISNDLIGKMEKKQEKKIKSKKNSYDPTKKLNDMKISLTYMEWYMKTSRSKGGYYDYYTKENKSREQIEAHSIIVTHKNGLNKYWEKTVTEKDQMPQKEGAKLRKRWLYGGTNYRRIIEPLDIAIYYKKGNRNYIANRPNHYRLLEKWSNEDKKNLDPSDPKKRPASLTEDSCFWAYVEEALILLSDLKNGNSGLDTETLEQGLIEFETKLMGEIKEFSVSADIFVQGSSLMKWWSEYKAYKGSSYASEFAQYMNNKRYEAYQALSR